MNNIFLNKDKETKLKDKNKNPEQSSSKFEPNAPPDYELTESKYYTIVKDVDLDIALHSTTMLPKLNKIIECLEGEFKEDYGCYYFNQPIIYLMIMGINNVMGRTKNPEGFEYSTKYNGPIAFHFDDDYPKILGEMIINEEFEFKIQNTNIYIVIKLILKESFKKSTSELSNLFKVEREDNVKNLDCIIKEFSIKCYMNKLGLLIFYQ